MYIYIYMIETQGLLPAALTLQLLPQAGQSGTGRQHLRLRAGRPLARCIAESSLKRAACSLCVLELNNPQYDLQSVASHVRSMADSLVLYSLRKSKGNAVSEPTSVSTGIQAKSCYKRSRWRLTSASSVPQEHRNSGCTDCGM